ncbi:MAG: L-aspartate oxidase [Rubrobacteraceae bacterium]|nr:L-aspartate oxidase [Rubrobacteraceae bacterium]
MLRFDLVVVGGGIAGCTAALAAAREGARVALLTRHPDPEESNTRYAQGGIIHPDPDEPRELLIHDILEAGGGEPEAARLLAAEGPELVERLLIEELGVPFDRDEGGALHRTREAAHSTARVIHRRDTTGAAIQEALTRAVLAQEGVRVFAGVRALSLLSGEGGCGGVVALYRGEILGIVGRTVLATGGLGALYRHTTNPPGALGEGIALALRAGAKVADLHYVQFHPTALYEKEGERRFLVSEAVRGEGAVLVGEDGEEIVDHPLGSLAPRDVVARAVWSAMAESDPPCVYLDATGYPPGRVAARFPAIYARCREIGIDPERERIPVVPAAHYSCGGVEADANGRTTLEGLWAAGEVARTGLHGANRLASTSLLEGLVWGWRAGRDAASSGCARPPLPLPQIAPPAPAPEAAWRRLREVMWERGGILRTAAGLQRGIEELEELRERYGRTELGSPLLVARTILEGALAEGESRGCHHREDAPVGSGVRGA